MFGGRNSRAPAPAAFPHYELAAWWTSRAQIAWLPGERPDPLSLRNRTMAIRGLEPSRNTIPPAARIGARPFAESVMSMLCRTNVTGASKEFAEYGAAPPCFVDRDLQVASPADLRSCSGPNLSWSSI